MINRGLAQYACAGDGNGFRCGRKSTCYYDFTHRLTKHTESGPGRGYRIYYRF